MFKSFRHTLIWTVVAATVAPTIVVSLFLVSSLYQTTSRSARGELDLRAASLAAALGHELDLSLSRLRTLAESNDVILAAQSSLFGGQASDVMARYLKDNALIGGLYLVDRSLANFESVPIGSSRADLLPIEARLRDLAERGEIFRLHVIPYADPDSLALVTPLVSRRTNELTSGDIVGFLVATLPFRSIMPFIERNGIDPGRFHLLRAGRSMVQGSSPEVTDADTIVGSKPFRITDDLTGKPLEYEVRILADEDEVYADVRSKILQTVVTVLGMALIMLCLALAVAHRLSSFLVKLRMLVEAFSQGKYDTAVSDLRFVEFRNLTGLLSEMGRRILGQIEAAQEKTRIEAELEAARTVQESLFPSLSECPGIDLAFKSLPASQTSGDWFGYYYSERLHRLQFFLADVTGHGISSALMTGVGCGGIYGLEIFASLMEGGSESDYRSHLLNSARTLNKVFALTGQRLAADAPMAAVSAAKMMTLSIVSVHLGTGHVAMLNAGHPTPWILRKDGIEVLQARGPIIGESPDALFHVAEAQLAPGDGVFAYTDGLVENRGPTGRRLKTSTLKRLLSPDRPVAEGLDALVAAGREVWGVAPLKDDVTSYLMKWERPVTRSDVIPWADGRLGTRRKAS